MYVKNVHPAYGAGIQTHDLKNMSLFPLPLDHGYRPNSLLLWNFAKSKEAYVWHFPLQEKCLGHCKQWSVYVAADLFI